MSLSSLNFAGVAGSAAHAASSADISSGVVYTTRIGQLFGELSFLVRRREALLRRFLDRVESMLSDRREELGNINNNSYNRQSYAYVIIGDNGYRYYRSHLFYVLQFSIRISA